MKSSHRFWVVLAFILGGTFAMPVHAGQLLAGAARISITPIADEFPYTAPRERAFVGVHDDVYVRALVLDDGKQRVALVVVDATRVPHATELIKVVARELGAPESNVLISATHTHNVLLVSYEDSEPNQVQNKEIERIQQAALEAVREAKAQLRPARIAFARGRSWVSENGASYRPLPGKDMQDLYFPEGPSDKSLDLIKLESLKGEPLALLVNYPTHGEVMFRSVTRNNGYEVSGDLPGAVARLLEATPAAAPVVLFTAAAEADQLPLYKSVQTTGKLDVTDEGAAGWAVLDVQARRLVDSVLDTLDGMNPGESDVQLLAATGSVTCPGKKSLGPPQGSGHGASGGPETNSGGSNINGGNNNGDGSNSSGGPDNIGGPGGQPANGTEPIHAGTAAGTPVSPVKIPIALLRINDIVLGGVAGDVASEIGQHFKSASPVPHTTFVSMLNGDIGYILTDTIMNDKSHGENHGVGKTPVKSGCAEPAIIKGLLGLMGTGARK